MARQLISEVKGWHWLISWDNPLPKNSSSMLSALSGLGQVHVIRTKTTVLLAPYKSSKWQHIRTAIETNLNASKRYVGKAVYANLRSGFCFECVMTRPPSKRWKRLK